MPSNTEPYRVLPVGATFDESGRNHNSEQPKPVAARPYAKGTHESTVFSDGAAPRSGGKRQFNGGAQRETAADAPSAVQLKQPSAAAQAYNAKVQSADAAGVKPTGSKRVIPPPANNMTNSCTLVSKDEPAKEKRHYAAATNTASNDDNEATKGGAQPAARRRLVADLSKDPFGAERTKGTEPAEPSSRQKCAAEAKNKTGETMQYAMGQKTHVAQKSDYKVTPPYEVDQNE